MFFWRCTVSFKAVLVSDEEKYIQGCKPGMFNSRPARVSFAARGLSCKLYRVFTFLRWINRSLAVCISVCTLVLWTLLYLILAVLFAYLCVFLRDVSVCIYAPY
jgi:ABC-type polysaccharide/polyol phosphate export permease